MIITAETVFSVDGCRCFIVVLMDETGAELKNVVRANTVTGEYEQLVTDEAGNLVRTDDGALKIVVGKCEQFFFTIATPCRCEDPTARSCGPICSGAAKE